MTVPDTLSAGIAGLMFGLTFWAIREGDRGWAAVFALLFVVNLVGALA